MEFADITDELSVHSIGILKEHREIKKDNNGVLKQDVVRTKFFNFNT